MDVIESQYIVYGSEAAAVRDAINAMDAALTVDIDCNEALSPKKLELREWLRPIRDNLFILERSGVSVAGLKITDRNGYVAALRSFIWRRIGPELFGREHREERLALAMAYCGLVDTLPEGNVIDDLVDKVARLEAFMNMQDEACVREHIRQRLDRRFGYR